MGILTRGQKGESLRSKEQVKLTCPYCSFVLIGRNHRLACFRSPTLLSWKGAEAVTHEILDQIKLAQHRLIAKKLQENPEPILVLARRNLRRYMVRRPAPATYLWREWLALLEQNSVDHIVAVMTAKTQKATELRQASPFAGALSQEEIARTIQREKKRARTRY
jgi:hypothetical protein